MPASLSEMLEYAKAKAGGRNSDRLANLVATGIEGFQEGEDIRNKKLKAKLDRLSKIADIDKTLGDLSLQKSQIEVNDAMMKAMGIRPLDEHEQHAADGAALDAMDSANEEYQSASGNRPRKTPITKSERVQSISGFHDAEDYDIVPGYNNGKWGMTLQPKTKRLLDQKRIQQEDAQTDLTKQRTMTEGARRRYLEQQTRTKKATGGAKPPTANQTATMQEKIRKLAIDMATREEVAKQQAQGTYDPNFFKYQPTEDQVQKYTPAAAKHLGGDAAGAERDAATILDQQDPLGKFRRKP